jgi:hypothetical protein
MMQELSPTLQTMVEPSDLLQFAFLDRQGYPACGARVVCTDRRRLLHWYRHDQRQMESHAAQPARWLGHRWRDAGSLPGYLHARPCRRGRRGHLACQGL